MRRLGLALLAAGVVALWLGPGALFASWGLALAGLVVLALDPLTRAPAGWALGALVACVVLGVAGAGVVVGFGGRTVADTPTLDPTTALEMLALVAVWIALAVLLVGLEWPRGRRLAAAGAALLALGILLGGLFELARHGDPLGLGIVVGPAALGPPVLLGGILLAASLVRQAFTRPAA
jgi:hypothetical protein